MKNLNILIVEGNLKEENQNFLKVGIQTHTESLKDSLNVFNNNYHFDVINPSSDQNLDKVKNKLPKYDGLIWGGSSLNIYNNTPEIKRQIEFMRECQKQVKNILAICWGMQVAQSSYFTVGKSKIYGLQYHPEITYEKMISLIEFRKDRLIQTRKVFRDEEEIKNHILFIKKEIAVSNKSQRMIELKNWMDSIN